MTGEVQIIITPGLSDQVVELLSGYLVLYREPKFAACIVLAFAVAHLLHVILRAYLPAWRRITIALWLVAAHVIAGAIFAHLLLQHMPDVEFYKYFTGVNSIALYWGLIWVSTRLFKMPVIARWLSLRNTAVKIVNHKPVIEFGDTIKFLRESKKK